MTLSQIKKKAIPSKIKNKIFKKFFKNETTWNTFQQPLFMALRF